MTADLADLDQKVTSVRIVSRKVTVISSARILYSGVERYNQKGRV